MKLLVLIILFVIMALLNRGFAVHVADLPSLATISLGFILVSAFLFGKWFRRAGLPLITGYLIAGLVCGPYLLGFLSNEVISELKLIDSIALSLIALTAGGEILWAELKKGLKGLVVITGFQSLFTLGGTFLTVLLALKLFPVFGTLPDAVTLSAAVFISVIATANSPSTVIAVVTELRARGRVTETILGVTVLKDVLVIVAFAGAVSLSRFMTAPAGSFDTSFIGETGLKIFLSLCGGILLGCLLIFYLSKVKGELALFMIGISYLSTEMFHHFGLHPLLATVVAGFVVQNCSPHGGKFIESLERASLPVYVVFFAITGAGLDLSSLTTLWMLIVVLVVARAVWIFLGTYAGASLARESDEIRKLSWFGFLPQAGVSIGLAVLIADSFIGWGQAVKDLAITMIAINQIVGPIGLKYALIRSGEARGRGGEEEEDRGPLTPFHVMIRSQRI